MGVFTPPPILALAYLGVRLFQIFLLLTPIVGLLGWFTDVTLSRFGFVDIRLLPEGVAIIFIVSIVALGWSLLTVLSMFAVEIDGKLVAVIDFGIMGALIGGVVRLRFIQFSCLVRRFFRTALTDEAFRLCASVKASWILAIIALIMFFVTGVLALLASFLRQPFRFGGKRRRRAVHAEHAGVHVHVDS
ncbi:hypothetical protein XA68_15677 [Ophiocordyceps unilateralis]|uniref:MARVEL domain-containing protein n=1 Tax=Ophiocordyceps unilateralis TaxID=268505 RepID=A0A2A9P6M1_OPHUN|nr:hypothetical protein XA68_15677 [Ophiocordyceps unilateralis]